MNNGGEFAAEFKNPIYIVVVVKLSKSLCFL